MRLFNDAIQRGANIERSFDYGWRPLHWASFKGNQALSSLLALLFFLPSKFALA